LLFAALPIPTFKEFPMAMLKNPAAKYKPAPTVNLRDRTWPDAVLTKAPIWCSSDLRDGNQALIEPMDAERKLRVFETLVRIGFKEIEVGFPSASQTDFDFVRLLIEKDLVPDDVTIQVLTQAREHLIRRSFESVVGAKRVIMHLYNATAPVMRRVVLGVDVDGVVELAASHARLIKQLADAQPGTDWRFEYSPETFSDTELEVSKRVVDAVTAEWQPTPERKCIINLPTTIEHSTPNVFADMIEWMHRHLERRDSIVLSVHPHNDRGTGTAAGEFGLMAGAERVEGCLFGNGERTGNVDLVNITLNLYTQGVDPQLDFSDIDEIRRTVEYCNQLPVHPRHPYVGDLVYTSFSGSHQDAIKKAFAARKESDIWEMPYLPIDPKDLGRSYEAVIRVNSQSGKGGISYLLENEYGLELPRRLQIEFSQAVQKVMDAEGREVTAEDIWRIFQAEYGLGEGSARLAHVMQTETAGRVRLRAEVNMAGRGVAIEGEGNGPVDAFVDGVSRAIGAAVKVADYHEHSIGGGAQARAAAYLEVRVGDGPALFGVGIDENIVNASLQAVLSAVARAGALQGLQPAVAAGV
jgi:2-isopropylmalate synthase